MGELVNLRLVKKRREHAARAAEAAARRASFGRTKAEKAAAANAEQRQAALLDQVKLDAPS